MKNKLVAIRTIYPVGWKLGESPEVQKQGECDLPDNWHDEDCERITRRTFPKANGYRAYDEFGRLALVAINQV